MIKVKDYEVPNTLDELTVEQWEKVSRIVSDESLGNFHKWMDIFYYLGVDDDVWDESDTELFAKAVKDFGNIGKASDKLESTIELNGRTYKAFEDEFKLSVRDLRFIENKMRQTPDKNTAYVLAVIFKDTELGKNEHYDNAHLKHKESLFSKLPAAIAVPYVTAIGKELATALNGDS